MNKGVKRIGARNLDKGPSFLEGDKPGIYFIQEWLPDTKEHEKINVHWSLRYKDGLLDRAVQPEIVFKIPKHNCGGIPYVLSACLMGSRGKGEVYMNITGYCEELVRYAQWAMEESGSKVEIADDTISWGLPAEIHIATEGLNGYFLALEVFAMKGSKPSEKNDFRLESHTVECIDGMLDYVFENTHSWFTKLKAARKLKAEQEVYVKVKWKSICIPDENGEEAHARFLRFKNSIGPNYRSSKPKNNTILRIGQQEGDPAEYDHCTFSRITIMDHMLYCGISIPYTVFKKGRVSINKNRHFIKKVFIYFDFNKSNLRPDGIKALDIHTEFLKNRKLTIKLEGHTDDRGTERYNDSLGYKRAVSVATYLKGKGIDPDKIEVVSFGEYRPVLAAETEPEHAENRRVEMSFDVYETNEDAIKYDTIAPPPGDEKRLVSLDIDGFNNQGCLKEKEHTHPAETLWIDHQGVKHPIPLELIKMNTLHKEIYSKMHQMDFLGVLLFSPTGFTGPFGGISFWEDHLKVFANAYALELHSCAYYSVPKRNTLSLTAYPDTWVATHFQFNFKEDYFFRGHPITLIKGMESIEAFFHEKVGKHLKTPDPIVPDINKIILEVLMKWIKENIDKFKSGVHAYHTILNHVPKQVIDYSEKYRTYMEINHIVFGLYLFVIEILLIIVTRGGGVLGKLNTALKDYKWIDAISKSGFFKLGAGMQDPQIAMNSGGYFEKMPDGRVAYMYRFNFNADPLVGMDLSFSVDIRKPVKKGVGKATDNPLFGEFLQKIVEAMNIPEAKFKVSVVGKIGFEINVFLNTLTHEITWQDMASEGKKKFLLNHNELMIRPKDGIQIKIELVLGTKKKEDFTIHPFFFKEPLLDISTELKLNVKFKASGSLVFRRVYTFGSNPYFTDYLFFTGFQYTFSQKMKIKVKRKNKSNPIYDSNPNDKKIESVILPEKLIPLLRMHLAPPKVELLLFNGKS